MPQTLILCRTSENQFVKEVIPMRKRTYRAVAVKQMDMEQLGVGHDRLILGCDAAKEVWYGAWMNAQGEVLQTIRWDQVDERRELLTRLGALHAAGVTVEVAVEPTATYADAVVAQLLAQGVAVYRINTKHSHDYQEIYDGVPSGHDAKAAAIVAKLHLERGRSSRRWPVPTPHRRELRMCVAALDWIKQDEEWAVSRLLARHWPELLRLLPLTGVTAAKLLADYGSPAAVAADPDGAVAALRQWARGQLSADTRARVVASAKATLGIPMLTAERRQVEQLATTLRDLRCQRHAAEQELTTLAASDPTLVSISPVVGQITAAVLYATLGDLRDYTSVRALYRAPGLNLREHSSGKKKGQLTITKRGSAVARRWLFLATLRWIKADPVARAWYHRKVQRNGGVKRKAIVALMRKLLAALYHVVRGATYDPFKLFDARRLHLPAA
jgi:transposase